MMLSAACDGARGERACVCMRYGIHFKRFRLKMNECRNEYGTGFFSYLVLVKSSNTMYWHVRPSECNANTIEIRLELRAALVVCTYPPFPIFGRIRGIFAESACVRRVFRRSILLMAALYL